MLNTNVPDDVLSVVKELRKRKRKQIICIAVRKDADRTRWKYLALSDKLVIYKFDNSKGFDWEEESQDALECYRWFGARALSRYYVYATDTQGYKQFLAETTLQAL